MKIKSIFTAAVALTLGLTACNKEELLLQDNLPENAVRITASVGNPFAATRSNPVGTVAEQAKFNSGDKILVTSDNNNEDVVYQFDGTTWTPTGSKYLLWISEDETFYASYPVSIDNNFLQDVQHDQSTMENLSKSDLMGVQIHNAKKGDVLNFVMDRYTSRIIINIAGFNPEFSTNSKVDDVKVVVYNSTTNFYKPYEQGDGYKNSTYTLLADTYMNYMFNMYVSLKVGEKEMRSPDLPDNMDLGKSYTFNLIVGKEKLEIESVTVADWSNGETIPGGEAGERT